MTLGERRLLGWLSIVLLISMLAPSLLTSANNKVTIRPHTCNLVILVVRIRLNACAIYIILFHIYTIYVVVAEVVVAENPYH